MIPVYRSRARRVGIGAAYMLMSLCLFLGFTCLQAQSPDHLGQIKLGELFPIDRLPTTDGKHWSIQDERGRRVILHVYASW